jgi:hypothetical protein
MGKNGSQVTTTRVLVGVNSLPPYNRYLQNFNYLCRAHCMKRAMVLFYVKSFIMSQFVHDLRVSGFIVNVMLKCST